MFQTIGQWLRPSQRGIKSQLLVLLLRHVEQLAPGALAAGALANEAAGFAAALLPPLQRHPEMYNLVAPLLADDELAVSLPDLLREAAKAGPLTEHGYRAKSQALLEPYVAQKISADEFRHLTLLEQRVFAPPQHQRPVAECLEKITRPVPRYPGDDETEESVAYILSLGKPEEPPVVSHPAAASFALVRAGNGTVVDVDVDASILPEDTACVYLEVDTDPGFSSPNHAVWPPLFYGWDHKQAVIGRGDSVLALLHLRERHFDGASSRIRLPVPIELLFLPKRRRDIQWSHIAALAHRIKSIARTPAEIASLAFDYTKIMFWYGFGTELITPLELLRLGNGGCGHFNEFGALLMELCGIHVRGVGGFTPSLRLQYPGGGHSAYEYFDAVAGGWRYFDPYFDLHLPVPAGGMRSAACGNIAVNRFYDTSFETRIIRTELAREPKLTSARTLAELFVFRRYFDRMRRVSLATFLELRDEAAYGLDWELASPKQLLGGADVEMLSTMPEKIYARARYLVAKDLRPHYFGDQDAMRQSYGLSQRAEAIGDIATLSPWQTAELPVRR